MKSCSGSKTIEGNQRGDLVLYKLTMVRRPGERVVAEQNAQQDVYAHVRTARASVHSNIALRGALKRLQHSA